MHVGYIQAASGHAIIPILLCTPLIQRGAMYKQRWCKHSRGGLANMLDPLWSEAVPCLTDGAHSVKGAWEWMPRPARSSTCRSRPA